MKCSQCSAELAPGEVFCGECGQPVQVSAPVGRICPQCTTTVEEGKRFCGSCGYDLKVAPARPQTSATASPVSAPQVTATASTNPSRTLLVLGLVAVVAVFLLGALGLWLWLGSSKQDNANTEKTNANIAGVWNCDYLPQASEPERGQMNLTQNGPAITGTLTSEGDTTATAGTFDGRVLAMTSPRVLMPLTLSPDGLTMKGSAVEEGVNVTVICRR